MALEEVTLALFAVCNSVRVVAYVPQILKADPDQNGASAISSVTWLLFLASHVSLLRTPVVNRGDWAMASTFLANAAACVAILVLVAWETGPPQESS